MHLDDIEAWRRLGRAVAKRRGELRLNQSDLRGRGGPSLATVQSIEGGHSLTYRDRTLADLETSLGWARGSVETVLFSGGDPVGYEQPRRPNTSAVIDAILADPSLLPEAKQHLVNQYGLLLRVQAAAAENLPTLTPAPEPLTPDEEEFVATGQADLDKQASELHVVDNGDTCQ